MGTERNPVLALVACLCLSPSPIVPTSPNRAYDNAYKASRALACVFYNELRELKVPLGIEVREIKDTGVLFSDDSTLGFRYTYVKKRLKVEARYLSERIDISHSFICRFPLTKEDEEQFKYLVMWHLITALNPSDRLIEEIENELCDYPIE